jgi:hypothetical protein
LVVLSICAAAAANDQDFLLDQGLYFSVSLQQREGNSFSSPEWIMKRILIAAILGIAAAAPGQNAGGLWFQNYFINYSGNSYHPAFIFYTPGVPIPGSDGFHAELAYAFGTFSDSAGGGALLPTFALQGTLVPIGGGYSFGPGTFNDIVEERVPDYPGGPVTLEVLAFNGASYETSTVRGHSAAFTLPYLALGAQMPPTLDGMQSFTVMIPEPSGLALAGLGAMTLMIFRRRRIAR